MASIYVARHSLALWGDRGCIGAVELTPDEQDAIAQQLLRHAADRRKNGDHHGAKERWGNEP